MPNMWFILYTFINIVLSYNLQIFEWTQEFVGMVHLRTKPREIVHLRGFLFFQPMKITSKLHYACHNDDKFLRCKGVYFSDKYAYATNGHILIRQSIDLFEMSEPEKECIKGKYILSGVWKKLCEKGIEYVQPRKDGIRCATTLGEIIYPYFDPSNPNPLDYESTLNLDFKPTGSIGFNPTLLHNLRLAFADYDTHNNRFKFEFCGENKPIRVSLIDIPIDEQVGILMPFYMEGYPQ